MLLMMQYMEYCCLILSWAVVSSIIIVISVVIIEFVHYRYHYRYNVLDDAVYGVLLSYLIVYGIE